MIRQLPSWFEQKTAEVLRKRHQDQQHLLLQTMAVILMTSIGGLMAMIFGLVNLSIGEIELAWFFLLQVPYSVVFILGFWQGWLSLRFFISGFILSTAMFTTYSVATDGGLSSPFLPWLSLSPLVGFVLLGQRGLFIWGGVCALFLFLFVFDLESYLPIHSNPPRLENTPFSYTILYMAEMTCVALVVWIRQRSDRDRQALEGEMSAIQEREKDRREGEQKERERILELLNQELEPLLQAAEKSQSLLLQALPSETDPDGLRHGLEEIRVESQRIVRNLSQVNQVQGSFQEAVQRLVADFRQQQGIEVELAMPGAPVLPMRTRNIHLYRILQEAFRNISRHAQASLAQIHIQMQAGQITRLDVKDNGRGLPPGGVVQARKQGMGLQNMADRMAILGGEFTLVFPPTGGTHIRCTLPVSQAKPLPK